MKKHIPFLIALALLSISLISSCKKDPVPNNNQNNDQPTDTIPAVADVLHFGESTGMIVTTYNTVVNSFNLDIVSSVAVEVEKERM